MPDVTVDGAKIIMAQGVDGSWYAYVAQADAANNVDSYYNEPGTGGSSGSDFGRVCGPTTDIAFLPSGGTSEALAPTETRGIFIPNRTGETGTAVQGTSGYSAGDAISACTITDLEHTAGASSGVNATSTSLNNVVREATALSNATSSARYGNIQLGPNLWPMVQLFDFSSDAFVDITYNRAVEILKDKNEYYQLLGY